MKEHFTIIFAFFLTVLFSFQGLNAEDFIKCDFSRKHISNKQKPGEKSFSFKIVRENGKFYLNSNFGGPRALLFFHKFSPDVAREIILLRSKAPIMVTVIETLKTDGINVASIDISTKKAWHSRHTAILSQYTGKYNTNIALIDL